MILPSRSALWKTVLLVFIAGLCLFSDTDFKVKPAKITSSKSVPTAPRIIQPADSSDANESEISAWQFGTRWAKPTDPVLLDFVQWTDRYLSATSTERAALVDEGIVLAKQRRERVAKIIRTQPKLALAQTPPYSVRSQLPKEITDLLEQRFTGKGDFLVLGRTGAQPGNSISRRASIQGENFEASVYGDRLAQRSARNISLHGVALDGSIALSDSPLRALEEGEPIPADKPLAASSCVVSGLPTEPTASGPRKGTVAAMSGDKVYWLCCGGHLRAAADGVTKDESQGQIAFDGTNTFGPHSLLVILVDFSTLPGGSTTVDAARPVLDAVDTFYHQNSYGDFSFATKTITPVLRLPRTSSAYFNSSTGDTSLLDDARNAARTAGFNPDNFDFDLVAFSNIGFPWRGQGYVGLKGAWVQGNGNFIGDVLGHELGHNLGVWHANAWTSPSIIGDGNPQQFHREYGDLFDVMSNGSNFPFDHQNANFKFILGWLPSSYVATVASSGTYRIYAHDENSRISGRKYAVRIPVGISIGGELEDYWIELRQLLAPRYQSTANGAIIQWGNDVGTQSANRLLDMSPETADLSDAPLAVGRTFKDVDRGVEITLVAKEDSGVDAHIDLQINVTLPPVLPLDEALDTTNLAWTTSANAWAGEHGINHDGVDAAASPATRDNGESYFETTVNGPGGISFWWKASTEQDFDYLRFKVDGVEFASISGEVDWEQHAYEIPDGTHVLRWTYTKDATGNGGADRAWVDQVQFIVGDRAPFINVQPAPLTISVGDTAHFQVQAGGSEPLRYQWKHGTTDLPAGTNSTLNITNAQVADAGQYSVTITNAIGKATSSSVLLTVLRSVPLNEALDFVSSWETFGAAPWRGETDISSDAVDAAQSGAIADGKSSSLATTLAGPGNFSFWWKVSSEEKFDVLTLYLDGEPIDKISGEIDWTQKSVLIPNGSHLLRWTYAKDQSLGKGADAAWVDRAQFEPIANLPASIKLQPVNQAVSVGGTAIFRVGYAGSDPVVFQWFLNDKPLDSRPGLTGVNSAELTVSSVASDDAGKYTALVKNSFGQEISLPAVLSIVPLSLADAVDESAHAWTTGGEAPWSGIVTNSHDTIDVAVSGAIGNNTNSWIQTEVNGPATVSFWWRVSSETNYDYFSLQVDAVEMRTISGASGWRQEAINIGAGLHRVRWIYQKDSNNNIGSDKAWLDQVQIISAPAGPQITGLALNANGLTGTINGLQGARYILEVSSDLVQWTPVATNDITSATMPFTRSATKTAEYIRLKIE